MPVGMPWQFDSDDEEAELKKKAAGAGGKGGGSGGGMGDLMGGGTNIISNVADTALQIYLDKKRREEEEKAYKNKLMLLGQKNMGDAAESSAAGTLNMTGLMGQAYLRSLVGR